jgi:hypothetical protein
MESAGRRLLLPHPEQPAQPVALFAVMARLDAECRLQASFTLQAELAAFRLPSSVPGDNTRPRVDGLWQHSCFELFLRQRGRSAYYEFNFAPSGAWAAYGFSDLRRDMTTLPLPLAPATRWVQSADRLELHLTLPATALPGLPLSLAATAVLETAAGGLTYWSLAHAPGPPDFHHPDGFVLALDED